MAEIKNVGGGGGAPIDRNVEKLSDEAIKLPNQQSPQNAAAAADDGAIGRGNIGQPVGLPTAEPTTQNALMPSVVIGRDPSQLVAADKLRANAGHSATEVLLGLNQQPSTLGALLAPPGNLEMLRHLSPAMRRKVLRNLLSKQRGQLRRLIAVMRDEEQNHREQRQTGEETAPPNGDETDSRAILPAANPVQATTAVYNQRALRDLEATTRMLDLLDELLGMQDYALSQMGTFAQG